MEAIPTTAQRQTFILCCWATKLYRSVHLVRIDERTGNVFILVGEEIEIEIKPKVEWIK
ncbi:DUF6888 family protein [Microcoleus sp. CZ3-B2]|uniref:DUF6888 family protein n=1 Tax=Microcoleaceae TaxID=1892252 RepID=UPI003FA5272A